MIYSENTQPEFMPNCSSRPDNIKTYKAKKAVYQEVENVQELCRLCLQETKEGVPIFNDGQDVCAAVAMRVMICVGLEIKSDNSLPNMICKTCHEELEKYYKFRRRCFKSYHRLKCHLIAMKSKDEAGLNKEVPTKYSIEFSEMAEEKLQEVQDVKMNEPEDVKQLTIKPSLEVVKNGTETSEEIKEVQVPLQAEVIPDIGTFLSGILTELGILQSEESGLMLHRGLSSFHLEMGDGEQLEVELVEEDEENVLKEQQPTDSQENVSSEILEKPALNIDTQPISECKTKRGKTAASRGAWCVRCGRAFSSRGAAARHAALHAALRPHACHCGASFAQKAVLQRHMLVHLEVRPHRCPQCNKSFTQRGALAAHARAHAPPPARLALHACTLCDKLFLHASGLSRHMFTHAGRVFECSACDKQFNDKSSLMRHLRNVYHKPPAGNTANIAAKNTPGVSGTSNTAPSNVITGSIARNGNTIIGISNVAPGNNVIAGNSVARNGNTIIGFNVASNVVPSNIVTSDVVASNIIIGNSVASNSNVVAGNDIVSDVPCNSFSSIIVSDNVASDVLTGTNVVNIFPSGMIASENVGSNIGTGKNIASENDIVYTKQ